MYSFTNLEPVCRSMSSSNCCVLTCIQVSQEAGQVVWYAHLSATKSDGPLIQATMWMHHKLVFSQWKKAIKAFALCVSPEMRLENANSPVIAAGLAGRGIQGASEVTDPPTQRHHHGSTDTHTFISLPTCPWKHARLAACPFHLSKAVGRPPCVLGAKVWPAAECSALCTPRYSGLMSGTAPSQDRHPRREVCKVPQGLWVCVSCGSVISCFCYFEAILLTSYKWKVLVCSWFHCLYEITLSSLVILMS